MLPTLESVTGIFSARAITENLREKYGIKQGILRVYFRAAI